MEWFKQTPALRQFETLILNGKVKILSIFTWVLLNLRWHILHLVKSSSKQLKFVCFAILECTLDVVVIKSSRPEVFCEKDVLRNFAKFIGKHLCQSLFIDSGTGVFVWVLRNFQEHLLFQNTPSGCFWVIATEGMYKISFYVISVFCAPTRIQRKSGLKKCITLVKRHCLIIFASPTELIA